MLLYFFDAFTFNVFKFEKSLKKIKNLTFQNASFSLYFPCKKEVYRILIIFVG